MKDLKPVSDKDFDKVFREKLSTLEMEPDSSLWAGISQQLSTKRSVRPFPVLWLAAGMMAAAIGAGMWLSAQRVPMKLTGMAKVDTIAPKPKDEFVVRREPEKVASVKTTPEVVETTTLTEKNTLTDRPSFKELATVASVTQVIDQPELLSSKRPSDEIQNTTGSINSTKEVVALALAPESVEVSELAAEAPVKKQLRIKSVGSLVNFVVSIVDKRNDKIIEFEDNDEGTKVSGLNLGLLKIQPKNN